MRSTTQADRTGSAAGAETGGSPCRIMGILNVTPDSFSDGGATFEVDSAVARAHEMLAQGAEFIDVGGESTRPGATRVPVDVELARVLPVVRVLAADGVNVSIDTMRARVAQAALDAGAVLVNDVSGGEADPAMLPLIAQSGTSYVLMHWRDHTTHKHDDDSRADVVDEVLLALRRRVDRAVDAGIDAGQIIVDPGLGFAKENRQNWQLLHGIGGIQEGLGLPILIGASRKRFVAELVGGPRATTEDRDSASAAISALAAAVGCWGVRVHNVHVSSIAVRVSHHWNSPTSYPDIAVAK